MKNNMKKVVTVSNTQIKKSLRFILSKAKEIQGAYIGGPYEETYNNELKMAKNVVIIYFIIMQNKFMKYNPNLL